MRLALALPFLVMLPNGAALADALPPGYVERPAAIPEDPLPPPPAAIPMAPDSPLVEAPDAHDLLKDCPLPTFTDCFRMWKPPPPPPPPPPETKQARQDPGPPDPNAPREPSKDGPLTGPPPAPNPAADQATYDSLLKALKETGLDGKVLMPEPPKGGSATMTLDPTPGRKPETGKAAPRRVAPRKDEKGKPKP